MHSISCMNNQKILRKSNMFEWYKEKKILVTGGAGFIGSHLVKKLVHAGACVTILDNFSTGSLNNLAEVYQDIQCLERDIRDFDACMKAAHKKEIIFHLAAFVSAGDSVEKAQECFETNVQGTLNILWAATQSSVEKFIFSSSAAVYGPQTQACHENMACYPISPYGHSKKMGETLCKYFQQTQHLTTLCLRYFNVYGPGQNGHAPGAPVLAHFETQLKANEPISILGNGMQTRDFIHVNTLVEYILKLSILSAEYISGEIINLATGSSKTLLEMLALLKDHYPNFNNTITFKPARIADITHSQADIQKLEKFLSYTDRSPEIHALLRHIGYSQQNP